VAPADQLYLVQLKTNPHINKPMSIPERISRLIRSETMTSVEDSGQIPLMNVVMHLLFVLLE
jgi:hypothetical protein